MCFFTQGRDDIISNLVIAYTVFIIIFLKHCQYNTWVYLLLSQLIELAK